MIALLLYAILFQSLPVVLRSFDLSFSRSFTIWMPVFFFFSYTQNRGEEASRTKIRFARKLLNNRPLAPVSISSELLEKHASPLL